MDYKLEKANSNDLDLLIDYKKRTIYENAKDLSNDEKIKIDNYINDHIPKLMNDYQTIIINGKVVGCLLATKQDDGMLLDEIYLEKEYRNNGIGTDILKDIITKNNNLYLWVYKTNNKAISLYQKLGLMIIDETDTRYYMEIRR